MFHASDSTGMHPVLARAKDAKDLMSDWSDAHILTVRDSLK